MKTLLVLIWIMLLAPTLSYTQIIIDADTGNEVDDLYAIARMLVQDQYGIKAIHAAHWQTSQWAIPETMENSHRLNQMLVGYVGKNIPTRRGGIARMRDWGDKAQYSAATHYLLKELEAIEEGEKLTILVLGALTNVASAIYIDPTIAQKMRIYWLGTTYDFESDHIKRLDFNPMMDQQAVEIVFNSGSELHVLPVNVASALTFNYESMSSHLKGLHPLTDFLIRRWDDHLDGGRQERVLWDLGIVECFIHPEWCEQKQIQTTSSSGNGKIYYYHSIDVEKIRTQFYSSIKQYFKSR